MTKGLLRLTPTRRLVAAVALLALPWLLSGSNPGLTISWILTGVLIVAMVLDAALSPWPGQIVARRSLPATVGVGDRADGEYTIESSWPRALQVRLYDSLPTAVACVSEMVSTQSGNVNADNASLTAVMGSNRADNTPLTTVTVSNRADNAPLSTVGSLQPDVNCHGAATIPPMGQATIALAIVGRLRGVHHLGSVALRVGGPLGLLERTHRIPLADTITVAPSVAGIRRYRLLSLQHRLRDAGVRTLRRRGEGTSFANLREYVPGDDPRHIDWKASARRFKPITREFSLEQGQTVMIVIDAGRLMTQLAGPFARFEYALSSALVLADVAAHSGDQVGLLLFDTEVRAFVAPARGRAALEGIRNALVPAAATMVEPDYAAAFRTLAARHRKRSLIVLFTDVIDVRASQSLIAHATRSAARHLPLVVALRNDELLAAALPSARSTSGALYESAAAEELLQAREEALGRMRGAGVAVVDASPERMTAAVINRYLEVKSRAAL